MLLFLLSQGSEAAADLDMIKGMVEDTLFSAHPAMVLNLKASMFPSVVRKALCL